MPLDAHTHERSMLDAFESAVATIPDSGIRRISVEDKADRNTIDGLFEFQAHGQTTILAVGVKRTVFPRDLYNIIHRLEAYRDHSLARRPSLSVIIAETISPGARQELQAAGVGFYDMSGSLFLPVPGAYILIEKPMTKKQDRVIGSVFEGKRSLVMEALWEAKRDWRGVKAIANRVGMSTSMVSETLQELERHGWIEAQGNGPTKERRLSDWEGLMDAWTDHELRRPGPRLARLFMPRLKPKQILEVYDERSKQFGITYETTAELAAAVYAPYLTQINVARIRVVPHMDALNAIKQAGAIEVNEGWNLGILTAGGDALPFRQQIDNIWYASELRTYFDLLRSGGRSKDQAFFLREQRLRLT